MFYSASETVPKKPGSIYNFFGRLFGGINPSQAQIAQKPAREATPEEEKTLSPSNSTELSQLGKVAGFVQGKPIQPSLVQSSLVKSSLVPNSQFTIGICILQKSNSQFQIRNSKFVKNGEILNPISFSNTASSSGLRKKNKVFGSKVHLQTKSRIKCLVGCCRRRRRYRRLVRRRRVYRCRYTARPCRTKSRLMLRKHCPNPH